MVLSFQEVSFLGLATHIRRFQLLTPWKPLSAPNALRLRPSKLCSSHVVDDWFPNRSSALALDYKTSRPCNRASAASSHLRSRAPFCSPEGLAQVRAACFLGLSDLSGFPAFNPCEKPSPLLTSPFHCSRLNTLQWSDSAALRFLYQTLGYLPPWRAPARMAFLTGYISHPLKS